MAAAQKRSFAAAQGASLVFWCECLPVARRRTRQSLVGSPALPFPFGTPSRRTAVFISQTPRTHLQEASRRTGSSAWQAVAASGGDFKGAPHPRRCEGLSSWSLGRDGTGPRQKPQRLRPLHQDGAGGPGSPALGPTGRGTPRLDGRRAGQRHDLGSTACPFLSRRLFSCKRRGWMQ